METTKYIWMDGKMTPWEQATTHILTHTLHYGGGAFEGIRFYKTPKGPAIFRLKEHIERLFYSAKALQMAVPFTQEQIREATIQLIRENKLESGYIRPLIYFGYGKMGLDPRKCVVNVCIAAWPWGSYLGENPVKTKISKFIRIHPRSTVADAKLCGHYVNSIMASLDIHSQGYDEAILLDFEGNIAEGPGENIFIVKDSKLITPPLGNILAGITRDSVMQIAESLNIKTIEQQLKPEDLFTADEAFYTGTAAEVTPIASVDDKVIGTYNNKNVDDFNSNTAIPPTPGPITRDIKEIFTKAIHGELPEYDKWLTVA